MKKFKQPLLVKILLVLLIVLMAILIIRELMIIKIIGIILFLLLPVLFGYGIAWLVKPIMFCFNRWLNVIVSSVITYLLIFILIGLISYLAIPVIFEEIKDLTYFLFNSYERIDQQIIDDLDFSFIGGRVLILLEATFNNVKNLILNVFYSFFIGFFFLINHQEVSKFLAKKVPHDLIYNLSINLKAYVKGTLLITLSLFVTSLVLFSVIGLPYALLFAILISLTNIIPYIGPYIGGIPATLVAFGISQNLGFMVLGIVIGLQIIESHLVHPIVMSKVLKVNQILIILSLIFFGYFFGILGMLVAAPMVSVIKTLYEYHKAHNIKLLLRGK